MNKLFRNRQNSGITLIALVITIVVLLILAGVSINLVLGNNGIITKAKDARLETRAASVEDKKDLWKADKEAGTYIETTQVQTLEELLDSLLQENLITETERNEIEEKGHTVIGSKDIVFADGFIDATYIVENSNDEVIFNKIIREGDVALEKPGFTNYTIEGISNDKEGTYISAGSVEGKSGNLEIIGNISDTTFRYNLTDFMKGDETFYCKINIDDEIFYKKINVIQGNAVTYEEDFIKNVCEATGIEQWEFIENENFSNGKGLKMTSSEIYNDVSIKFDFTGSAIELVTAITNTNEEIAVYVTSIYDEDGNIKVRRPCILDEEDVKYNIKFPYINLKENDLWTFELHLVPAHDYSQNPPPITTSYLYFDAVVIYK